MGKIRTLKLNRLIKSKRQTRKKYGYHGYVLTPFGITKPYVKYGKDDTRLVYKEKNKKLNNKLADSNDIENEKSNEVKFLETMGINIKK